MQEQTSGHSSVFPKGFRWSRLTRTSLALGPRRFRNLQQHAVEVQRCAVYLCRFAGTEQRRAVGCWSNCRALQQEGYAGWPSHVKHASQLQNTGPLPRSCPCVTQHMPMRGTASGQEFNSTHQQTLGVQFWLRALRDASPTDPKGWHSPQGWQYFSVGLRDNADPQTAEQYLVEASASSSPCLLRTISSACTVFSSVSKLAPHVPCQDDCSLGFLTWIRGVTFESCSFCTIDEFFFVVVSVSSLAFPCLSESLAFLPKEKVPPSSLRQRRNDGGKAVASGSGIALASGRVLVRLRFLCNLFVGRPFLIVFSSPSFTRTGRIDRFSEFPGCSGFRRSV